MLILTWKPHIVLLTQKFLHLSILNLWSTGVSYLQISNSRKEPRRDNHLCANTGKEFNHWTSQVEISKHSVSYDIYFNLHPLLLKIWVIIIVTSVVTEVLGFLYCTSPDIPDLISFRENFSTTVRREESIFLISMKIAVMTLGSIVNLFLTHSIRNRSLRTLACRW